MLVVSAFHSHFIEFHLPCYTHKHAHIHAHMHTYTCTHTHTQNNFIVLHGVYRKMDIELICDESKNVDSYEFVFDKETTLHYVSNVFD